MLRILNFSLEHRKLGVFVLKFSVSQQKLVVSSSDSTLIPTKMLRFNSPFNLILIIRVLSMFYLRLSTFLGDYPIIQLSG